MINKINELLKDFKGTQSSFQNQYFVVQKQGTKYAQFIQALRELSSRVDNLRTQTFSYQRHLIDIEEIEYKLSKTNNDFEKRRLEIDYKEKMFQTEPLKRSIKETEEDVELFYKTAILLKEEIGDTSKEHLLELEIDMWKDKVRRNIALDWQINGGLSKSSYEFLDSLPNKEKKEIVEEMKNQEKFIFDFEKKETFEIDMKKFNNLTIDKDEIKKLL